MTRSTAHPPDRQAPTVREPSTRAVPWLGAAIVFAIVFIAFLPALQNQFVDWDDTDNFLRNESFRGLGWDNIKWMFTTFHMGHYQPLTWLTLGADATIAKAWFHDALDPRPYHFTNVLLHSINAALVYVLAAKLIGWRAVSGPALIVGASAAALFFGAHPLRVESVAWATERRDLLSAFFVLLTILSYLRANRIGQKNRLRWMSITFALFACSLLSKVIGATLPVVLLILDWHPLRRIDLSPRSWFSPGGRSAILEKIPFFVLALIFSTIASIGQGSHHWLVSMELHRPAARVVQSLYGLMFYVQKTLWPSNLLPLYERHDPMKIDEPRFIVASVIVPIALICLAVLFVKGKWRTVVAAAAVYAVMLLPVLGIVQNGPQIVADRYSYLPCIGMAIALGAGGALLVSRRPKLAAPVALISIAVTATMAALTWRQAQVWRDTASLWTYMASHDLASSYGQNGYGYVLLQQGHVDEAIEHLNRAIDIQPANDKAHENLWIALRQRNDLAQLRSDLELSTNIPTLAASARFQLGSLLLDEKQYDQAAHQFEAALAINGSNAPSHVNLAIALERIGRTDEALQHYRTAVKINPNLFQARYNYGLSLERAGQTKAALEQLRRAVELNPSHSGARSALDRVQQTRPQQ